MKIIERHGQIYNISYTGKRQYQVDYNGTTEIVGGKDLTSEEVLEWFQIKMPAIYERISRISEIK